MKDIINLTREINQKGIFKETKKLDYSLMPIIYKKIRTKELLHSSIIESLMKQSQVINKSDIFFKCFFEMIDLNIDVDTQNINIRNEYVLENDKRIDTLLLWNKNAIIIENKLNNAPDQPEQIADYYDFIEKEGYNVLKIVYIPNIVTKHAPKKELNEEIKKLLIEIIPSNLIEWLKNVEKNSKITNANFKRELINYINILNYIEMENKRFEENFELSKLLSKDNSILTAYKIHERWNDIKWHTEWEFWNDLEIAITEKLNYKILLFQKYNPELIRDATHKSRNINYFYGLSFIIKKINDNTNICFYIERGYENLYYGLIIKDKEDKWIVDNNGLFQKTKNLLDNIDLEARPNWLGIKYFEPTINFKAFNDEQTLLLKNKEQRELVIDKYIKTIKDFLNVVIEKL